MNFRHYSHDQFWSWLKTLDAGGMRVVDFLSTDEKINWLYRSSAGVKERQTIREHTQYVFHTFYEQRKFYNFSRISKKVGFDIDSFFHFLIAIHDLGKPYAVQLGDRSLQTEFNSKVAAQVMKAFEFSENEKKLALALIRSDVIGELLQGKIASAEKAAEMMKLAALPLGLSSSEYFELQSFFFIIDAGAYPFLREGIFQSTADFDQLIPNNPLFHDLARLMNFKN